MFKLCILAAILAFAAAIPAPAPKPDPGFLAQPLLYNAYNPYSPYVGIGPLPYSYQPLIPSYSGVAPIYKQPTYIL
ncbi:neuropeptide-like 3 [Leptopilina heterotoma]|uniref:neuropeptide-like 3 n=1 Tax=Leptopilina heterotoma TaxID=63436 RepID=UPI001CA8F5E1|nr:neuropeptide-like 3 [Leptopilina heterotoma]